MKVARMKGEHVTESMLRGSKDQLKLPEGYRAQGLRVTLDGTANGFANLPGNRVDIIHTVTAGNDRNSAYATYLLMDVLVIAADLNLDSKGELAAPAQVVTFALKPEEVLIVNLAKEQGNLSLALRNHGEKVSEDFKKTIKGSDIRPNIKKEEVATVAPPPPPPPPPPPVEKDKPKEVEKPKVITGHFDVTHGTEYGPREVTRYYWEKDDEDSPERIVRSEVIESTRVQSSAPAPAAGASPRKGGGSGGGDRGDY
jgi:Flp pilus assembly protein CpaB